MEFPKVSKICLALVAFILLCPGMSWCDWSVLLFDDFDDGDYDGWSATHPQTGDPVTPPDVVSSPEGYSLRGVGSGYSQDPGLNVWLTYPLLISNAGELKIEMRAKSGPQWPNQVQVSLFNGSDSYTVTDYGESNQWAQFHTFINSQNYWYNHPINANVWHDFAWTRDTDGWWSLSIDGQEVWHNFCQDNRLTSFEPIGIHISRNQSEIEWVRISTSEPPIHDECANAIGVQSNEPYNGSTARATGTDTSSCSYNDTKDVWHSFTPKYNYEYTISLCGSTFDTTLSVFDDCNGTELACNDDTEPGVCPSKWQSQLTIPLLKGTTYFIRIAGYDGATGDYVLTITGPRCLKEIPGDANNDCKIDFLDFAIMALHWLECNLDAQEACWQ